MPTLDVIEIFGYNHQPDFQTFTLNKKAIDIQKSKSSYDKEKKIFRINIINLIDFTKNEPVWKLSWKNVGYNQYKTNKKNSTRWYVTKRFKTLSSRRYKIYP